MKDSRDEGNVLCTERLAARPHGALLVTHDARERRQRGARRLRTAACLARARSALRRQGRQSLGEPRRRLVPPTYFFIRRRQTANANTSE